MADRPNTGKWEIIHDPDDQLYFVVNRNGTRLPSKYTTRTMADNALEKYLTSKQITQPGPGRGHKGKRKENIPEVLNKRKETPTIED